MLPTVRVLAECGRLECGAAHVCTAAVTCALYALDEEQPAMFGMRIDASGKWQFEGTLAPRLDLGLRNPRLNSKDHSWAMRVNEKIMSSSVVMELLTRAEKCIVNEEAFVLGAKEAALAQTVEGLFGLDLAGLGAWTEPQKTDLRTSLSYMREVLRNKAMLTTSLTTGPCHLPCQRAVGLAVAARARPGVRGQRRKRGSTFVCYFICWVNIYIYCVCVPWAAFSSLRLAQ